MDVDLVLRVGGDERPVTVSVGPGATGADLLEAVAGFTGTAGTDAVFIARSRPLAATDELGPSDLPSGAIVHIGSLPGTESLPTASTFEVAVAGGLRAGPAVALGDHGEVSVGRGARCDLRLADPEVSRVHARLWTAAGRAMVADAGSANGIRVGAWRADGEVALGGGDLVALGESVLAVRPAASDPDAEVTIDPATGHRMVNRPPRIPGPDRLVELTVPTEPAPPRGLRFPWLATLAPAAIGGVLFLVLPAGYGVYLLAMLALSPLLALVNLVSDRRNGRREHTQALAAYRAAAAGFEVALATVAADEAAADRWAHPDLAELVRRTGARSARPAATLWERRRADPDYLRLRVGLADRPARVVLRTDPAALPPAAPTVHDVAVTIDLTSYGVLGLAGPRSMTLAAGRAAVAQAAALHSPAELGLVVITGRDSAEEWEWASWLPHTIPASAAFACRRLFATEAAQAERRLAELRRLIDDRAAERRSALGSGPPPGRALLVVLDGARRLRHLAGLPELLADGPAAGVYALCLDDDESALPDECGATVVATNSAGTRATVRRRGLSPVDGVLVDGLAPEVAPRLARALAPLRPHGERAGDSALPDRVRFLELAGLAQPTAASIRDRWATAVEGRSTEALLGVGPDGPVVVDLRRDGPHALIAGTSGAGKSELLQTLVAALALGNRPDALTFVLVDYKGGSAFAACADLPHCVGLVTDLDGHLVSRALDSLSAELRRREELFARARATDIEDYWSRTGDRLPRLVIVVDEFASLVEELPDFVAGVVGIGMRGRSLGVHVVLATQRPGGVVTADLRANVNLRISLRVTSAAESGDVVDAPDAARIRPGQPGRGYLRTGHGELTAFQAARISWPRPDAGAAGPDARVTIRARRVESLGQAQVPPADETADARTDLTELVGAIRAAAAGTPAPLRPWLPPLPELITLADLAPVLRPGPVAGVIGLTDRPRAQAQDPFRLDLERTGPVVVAGAVRAGRSTVLRTLAAVLADQSSPADLHLYALDCGNHALAPLARLPHCGAVVAGDDAARVQRLFDLLHAEVDRRQRCMAAGGHANLAEARAAVAEEDRLPYLVVLLDRLEAFLQRYAEVDGGRWVDRLESLLRTGPAVGMTMVLSSDRTGFHHRISSAVAARLVLRQATVDDAAAFGVDPRALPRTMPPGRAVWATTGEDVQVALLDPDPSGAAQAAAVGRLAIILAARWDGLPGDRLPRRLDPLPETIDPAAADALRRRVRPTGALVCTPAVGGDHLGPTDVDLAEAGSTFLIAGGQRSGRSTALVAALNSLTGYRDGTVPVLILAPRPSPIRDLAGAPGVLAVCPADWDEAALLLDEASARGPLAVLVDDAELLSDPGLADALEAFAVHARDRGGVLIAAAITEDVLANSYRGWLAAVRRARSGLLLGPASHVEGEVFGLRLPRSGLGGAPPGRGLLVVRGESTAVQVIAASMGSAVVS